MAYSYISAGSGSNGSSLGAAVSVTVDTSGANIVFVAVSDYTADSSTLTDNKSNSFTARTAYTGGLTRVQIYYVQGGTYGTSHTFTATPATTSYPSIAVMSFSGSKATPFDVENGAANDGSTSTVQPGSITPSEDNEVIALATGFQAGDYSSVDSGFSLSSSVAYSGGNHFGVAFLYLIETTAAAKNPTFTDTSGTQIVATQASFKAAAAGGSIVQVFLPLLGVG